MSSWKTYAGKVETGLEKVLFASRWLLAPFYLGLAISLVVLMIKFLGELVHLLQGAFASSETEVILGVLALVDLSLTASLIVIVIFSGYENFVSKIDHSGHEDWPEWMGTIDFTALKLKLLSSIVAISAIQLLKHFMAVRQLSDREIMWLVIIHVVFVVSSVLLALSDRIAGHGGGHGSAGHGPAGHGPAGNGGNGKASHRGSGDDKPAAKSPSHGEVHAAPEVAAPEVAAPQVAKPATRSATIVLPPVPDKKALH